MTQTNQPFFTVIIPTFNRANLLPRAIRSVLSQTEKDYEIIVTDDGSTDATPEVMAEILSQQGNIWCVTHKHYNLGASKNLALPLARGKYVTFLDDDDEYFPEHLSLRRKILDENPGTEFLYGGIKVIGDEFVPDKYKPGEKIHISEVVAGGTFFVRTDVFSRIGGFPEKNFGNDTEFYEKVIENKLNIVKVDFPTYIYYRSENSMTKNYKN